MSDQRLKIAVFIDFDNVEIGVKTTLGRQFDVGAVLEAIKERGEIITKVAYGDWKRAGDHGRAMAQHAVRLVQRVMTPGGDKNGADINLALDALEMAFTHDHINAFVIVGGDSDFITLVEKLKQYDKKVFVVGGRAFTSQVMQKNCTEFIAYENVTGSAPERPRAAARVERERSSGAVPLDQALPLVQRALKVLSDREVSPQLGLLKSTLLQLDSSFSERDYGAGTFRDFAEKLEKHGLVTLKHSGRTILVELSGDERPAPPPVSESVEPADVAAAPAAPAAPFTAPNLAEGVALVRALLAEATTPPRWPMYLRQMKQFIRAARPDFDERRYGALPDLMRACAKEGFVRLERDRQGGLRLFAPLTPKAPPLRPGWGEDESADGAGSEALDGADTMAAAGAMASDDGHEMHDAQDLQDAQARDDGGESVDADAARVMPAPVIDEPEDDQLTVFGALSAGDPPPGKARRGGGRSRKTPDRTAAALGEKPKRARKVPATRTRSRRTPS
jgi:uncharacterized LabA/DUF88 family protein